MKAVDGQLRLKMFQDMLRIRMVEETIADRYGQQEMRCPVHLSVGQEGIAVGVTSALEPQHFVLSTHRGHAHYLARGGDLRAMLAEIYGRAAGCCGGKGGSMHLIDLEVNFLGCTPIVGSSLPVAVGTAFGTWMKAESRVTVVFFGEGATEEGVFAESINFAALKKLPVVFVCENNLYSVYSPLSVRQAPGRDRIALVEAHGIQASRGDGNDVEQVHRRTARAVQQCISGEGPVFLEFDTYRWREHCGPGYDNELGYRTEEEYQQWRRRCPLENQQRLLVQEGLLTPARVDQMRGEIGREIDEAFRFAKESPLPSPEQLFTDVYGSERLQ